MISRLLNGAGNYKPKPPVPDGAVLVFGDTQLGYYGRIKASKFITGDALATLCALNAGTAIAAHSNTDWCKFAYKGKTLFVAAHILRHTISYGDLNSKQLVAGKLVIFNGKQYKVRLLSGGEYEGDLDNNEWDDLIYRIAPSAPTKPATLQKWDTLTPDDFLAIPGAGSGNKGATMCSTAYTYNVSNRVIRGDGTFNAYGSIGQGEANIFRGWRPVLEQV
jgi:hypothetical protein